jgi:hypothetical protein
MMRGPDPCVEIEIQGTLVGFLRRDIRQLADDERIRVERLVERVHREADPDQTVTRIVIETDYPDPDRLAYTASYRVQVTGGGTDGDSGECPGGG